MPSDIETDDLQFVDVSDVIGRLVVVSEQPPKERAEQAEPLATRICSSAFERGLPASQLTRLVDLVSKPNRLNQSIISTLIKSFYPSENIPPATIWTIVCSIGHGDHKPSLATQGLLLNWLLLVRDVLDDPLSLLKCYGVLFNQLGTHATQPMLCHLLAIITKRKHVKPWRIQMVLRYLGVATNPGPLLGLLRTYKEFHPDVVIDERQASGKPTAFKYPDPEFRARVEAIQAESVFSELGTGHANSFHVYRKGTKRARQTVPEVHTFHVGDKLVSLEEIDGVDDLVANLENIEPPSQMISALEDKLLQNYISLYDDPSHSRRIDEWLNLFFDTRMQAIGETTHSTKEVQEVLLSLLGYVRFQKSLTQAAQEFLAKLFDIWDGKEFIEEVSELLSYLPLQSFEDLQQGILSKFEEAVIDNTSGSLVVLLNFYTSLFRNWTSALFAHQSPPLESLNALSTYASSLLLQLLITRSTPQSDNTYPPSASLQSCLAYLSTVASTISYAPIHPYIRILTPPAQSVYLLAFINPHAGTLSPLCSILAIYKLAFEAAMSAPSSQTSMAPSTPPSSPYPRPYVNEFNGFLMDICNLLWRSRALNTSDQNALGCLIPGQVTRALQGYLENVLPSPLPLPALFTLSFHPALTALSISVLREIEDRAIAAADGTDAMDVDSGAGVGVTGAGGGVPGEVRQRHAGPVTQRSLATLGAEGGVKVAWADYRLEVLQWLDARGVSGIGELMYCTMKLLMGGKQQVRGTPR